MAVQDVWRVAIWQQRAAAETVVMVRKDTDEAVRAWRCVCGGVRRCGSLFDPEDETLC